MVICLPKIIRKLEVTFLSMWFSEGQVELPGVTDLER